MSCKCILKSGFRTGQLCQYPAQEGSEYCGVHKACGMEKIIVVVSLQRANKFYNYGDADAEHIISWYMKRISGMTQTATMAYTGKNTFVITYKLIPGLEFYKEEIADPDDDGNYPLTIGRTEYLVNGTLVKK
jgi:hypothetical protein